MATKKKDTKEEQISELTDHLKRLQAEFENYQKRVERERADLVKFVKCETLSKMLILVDETRLALAHMKDAPETVKKGVKMIHDKMQKMLEVEGVKEIECKGAPDPKKHEVVMQVDSEVPEGNIVEELQKGYTMEGVVLRYSKVSISRKKEEQDHKDEELIHREE